MNPSNKTTQSNLHDSYTIAQQGISTAPFQKKKPGEKKKKNWTKARLKPTNKTLSLTLPI